MMDKGGLAERHGLYPVFIFRMTPGGANGGASKYQRTATAYSDTIVNLSCSLHLEGVSRMPRFEKTVVRCVTKTLHEV